MAINIRELLQSDFSVATTGNAGPLKGDSDAPIGTVYIAIASLNPFLGNDAKWVGHVYLPYMQSILDMLFVKGQHQNIDVAPTQFHLKSTLIFAQRYVKIPM